MTKHKKELETLKQALNHNWPEIQMHLLQQAAEEADREEEDERKYETSYDGKRKVPLSFDSWWLKDFIREDVLVDLPGLVIMNTKPWHTEGVVYTFHAAYGIAQQEDCDDCFAADDIQAQIEIFPQGQFTALRISGPSAGQAIAMAVTMRTSRPPTDPILPWMEAIGDLQLGKHEADGEWLYGVEMAVHPMYQGHGIGTAMYEARFSLVRQLNLRGWYAVGMLMGYHRFADEMSVVEYGDKVISGEIKDPTVTMQMNRGFRAQRVVTDYVDEPAAADAGVLIVWENPAYEA